MICPETEDIIPAFMYEPLDAELNEIRLLTLYPGKRIDPVTTTIKTVSLENKPLYKTISYAWGDLTDTRPITIGTYAFKVTTNLETALRYLRCESQPVTLWVDAVCINQANNEEKSQQVRLMAEIFEKCQEVFIWLGSPSNSVSETIGQGIPRTSEVTSTHNNMSDLAQEEELSSRLSSLFVTDMAKPIPQLSSDYHYSVVEEYADPFSLVFEFASNKHILSLPCFEGDNKGSPKNLFFERMFEQFLAMSKLSWWRRTWTVQETILPPKATVTYGARQESWDLFVKAAYNFHGHCQGCCHGVYRAMQGRVFYPLHDFFQSIIVIEYARIAYHTSEYISPLAHLARFSARKTTDPRDKLYGTIGLQPKPFRGTVYNSLIPDYSKDYRKLFRDFSMEVIIESGSLQSLLGKWYEREESLCPSWVRDWNVRTYQVSSSFLHLINLFWLHYMAAPKKKIIAIPIGDTLLQTRGLLCGTVSKVFSVVGSTSYENIKAQISAWYETSKEYLGDSFVENDFWRTVMSDIVANVPVGAPLSKEHYRRTTPEDYRRCKAQFMPAKDFSDLENLPPVGLPLKRRRFYMTAEGKMGLGPPSTSIGDEIYVLYGSNIPFIVRILRGKQIPEIKDTSVMSKTFARLVGDCYLDGSMFGEAISGPQLPEKNVILC